MKKYIEKNFGIRRERGGGRKKTNMEEDIEDTYKRVEFRIGERARKKEKK